MKTSKTKPASPSEFRQLWLKRFGLKNQDATTYRSQQPFTPFRNDEALQTAVDYLFGRLSERVQAGASATYLQLAECYAWTCLALSRASSPYPPMLDACLERIRTYLEGSANTPLPSDVRALALLLRSDWADTACGLNRLSPNDAQEICANECDVYDGNFEEYLTPEGAEKFRECQAHLEHSAELANEWQSIKELFGNPAEQWPELVRSGLLRRPLLPERNWHQTPWWSFENEMEQFRVVFAIFCWKWFLWAMDGDRPLLMKPSVNLTPYGTQIFVPGYMSLDAKRDLDLSAISRLHKARGVQRQSILRNQVRALASTARGEGRSAIAAVRQAFPDVDERQIRRWLA